MAELQANCFEQFPLANEQAAFLTDTAFDQIDKDYSQGDWITNTDLYRGGATSTDLNQEPGDSRRNDGEAVEYSQTCHERPSKKHIIHNVDTASKSGGQGMDDVTDEVNNKGDAQSDHTKDAMISDNVGGVACELRADIDVDDLEAELDTGELESDLGEGSWERTLFDEGVECLECDACVVEGRDSPASVYCFDCEIYLCTSCQKWHKKLQTSRDHFCMHKDEIMGNVDLGQDNNNNTGMRSGANVSEKHQSTDHLDYGWAEVTIDGVKSFCGPCLYKGKDIKAASVCLDCLEYLCGSCTSSHLAVTIHKVVDMSDMRREQTLTQVVPVYEEKNYKCTTQSTKNTQEPDDVTEFHERSTPQTTALPYTPTRDKKFHHVDSFSIRISDDLQYPQVTGVAFTLDSRLLVCDKNNERVKMFSPELKPLSSLSISDLADVTVIDKITAVCTIPDKHKLAFVDIKTDLKLLMYTDTTVKYWGIEYFNHELFALALPNKDSSTCVHILDTTGNVISIIYPEFSLTDKLSEKHPKYLAVSPSGGTVYVTDIENRVIALGLDGRVVFQNKCQEMRSINGLVTDDRNVYACLEEESCLLRVFLDGSSSSLALGHMDSLDRPCCVAIDTVHKKLIVSELHTSIVQVYQM